jgi:hypothetical protein
MTIARRLFFSTCTSVELLCWEFQIFTKFGYRFRTVRTRRRLCRACAPLAARVCIFIKQLLSANILNQISRFDEHLVVFGGRATGASSWRLQSLLVFGGRATGGSSWCLQNLVVFGGTATGGGSWRLQNLLVFGGRATGGGSWQLQNLLLFGGSATGNAIWQLQNLLLFGGSATGGGRC